MGMLFLLSAPCSLLVEKFGIRKTAFVGGILALLGMFLSAFAVKDGPIFDEKDNSTSVNEMVTNLAHTIGGVSCENGMNFQCHLPRVTQNLFMFHFLQIGKLKDQPFLR